ncbi:DinB family protein [Blastococcus sp. SYSU DS0552]
MRLPRGWPCSPPFYRAAADAGPPGSPQGARTDILRVVDDGYGAQDPARVATGLRDAATALAGLLGGLDDVGWSRTGRYDYPAPALRDVDWIARHTLHELAHHLMDVDRGLGAAG